MNFKITFSVLIFTISMQAQAQPGLQSISGGTRPPAQPVAQVEIPSCDSGKRTNSPLVLKAAAAKYLNKANIYDEGRIFLEDYYDQRRSGSQATITIVDSDPVKFHYKSQALNSDMPGQFCMRGSTIVGEVTATYRDLFFQQKTEKMIVEIRNPGANEIRPELRGQRLDFVAVKVIRFKQVYNERNQLVNVEEPYENNFVYTTEKDTPKVQQQLAKEPRNATR